MTRHNEAASVASPRGAAHTRPRRARRPGRLAPPPVLVEHEVRIAGLDRRHDGLRIAQLSDVHVGALTPRSYVRRAVELANVAHPDLIVMTGDYVNWRKSEIPLMRAQLSGLRARRVVVTLGNHDYYASGDGVAAGLAANGYDVLRNQRTEIEVGGAPLDLIGIDDPVTRNHDLDAAFAHLPARRAARTSGRRTRIVLCHTPSKADELAARDVDLVLSGHTHGGQIFVRGITDRVASRIGLRYLSGFYAVGEQGSEAALYVTSGVGYSGVRVRAGAGTRSEVAVLTLRAG